MSGSGSKAGGGGASKRPSDPSGPVGRGRGPSRSRGRGREPSGGASAEPRLDPRPLLPLTDLAFNVLLALSDRSLHGYALLKELRGRTGREGLRTGTVYAALARLQDDGLVEEVGQPSGDDRRRHYAPTPLGRAAARAEAERLRELLAVARRKRVLPEAT